MSTTMLDHAIRYHNEGLDVLPVKPRNKAVALREWTEYQTRCSTTEEIISWWTETPTANIGIVSGVNDFLVFDFDHDSGVYATMKNRFPNLFSGRIEQSGSGAGYHLPLFVSSQPNLGYDNSKGRPKGNKVWHTSQGDVNIRARWCQTVVRPSVHPSGNLYRLLQEGDIVRAPDLTAVIAWLNELDPTARIVTARHEARPADTSTSLPIKNYYPSVTQAFAMLGYTEPLEKEPNGETRIPGHGGLLVDADDRRWYNFGDEIGGDVVDAFGWARFGAGWDRHNKSQFSVIMRDMEDRAGIGVTRQLTAQRKTRTYNVWGQHLRSNYWKV